MLAIKLALEEWRHYLEGARHQFIVYTDHKNLRKPEMLSQRQIRWYKFYLDLILSLFIVLERSLVNLIYSQEEVIIYSSIYELCQNDV